MSKEDYIFLEEKEFDDLDEKQKWNYVTSLVKMVKELQVQADKNCGKCEKNLMEAEDVNVDLFFEDWRACSKHCDECGEEEKRFMCDLQFQIINHLANTVGSLMRKQNLITKIVLSNNIEGHPILSKWANEIKKVEKRNERSGDLYQ